MTYRLSLLKIPVRDVSTSRAFYQDVLGFNTQLDAKEYGWVQMQAGEVPVALYEPGMGGGDGKVGDTLDFHLAVLELAKVVERLRAHGALVGDGILRGDDGSEFLEVRDPDGNTLKIMKS